MERLIDFEEARLFLGIQKSTLYDWIHHQRIRYVKVGRLVKFHREDLAKFVEINTVDTRKEARKP
jgi:excisionase family DNA binding protein